MRSCIPKFAPSDWVLLLRQTSGSNSYKFSVGEWRSVPTEDPSKANKYAILDENENKIGFAAEQQKGIFAFLLRQFLGHWRSFEIHFYDEEKKEFLYRHELLRDVINEL